MGEVKTLRVLFVEDNVNVTRAMARWLRAKGCEPTCVTSEAIACLHLTENPIGGLPFDAVITDWNLGPGSTSARVVYLATLYEIPVRVFSGSSCPHAELAPIWLGKTDLEGLEAFLKAVRK